MTAELIALVDAFLADIKHQSLVDGDRVRDFALDLRLLIVEPAEPVV